ncbi:MAG: hypothetical protein EOP52_01455 [Sphingobacteriales bacterium]|nr:MAG: hypothetical protein EOP52_01455 [Sphingobacteriales bacterium]
MKLIRISCLLLALPLVFLASCKKDGSAPVVEADGSNYFPVQRGHFVEYHVDSTYWDDFLQLETVHTMDLRHTVTDTFTDNVGRQSYTVTVSRRKDSSELWRPESVFTVTKTTNQVEWLQDNLRFVKMVFPVENGREWNGNEFVSTFNQDYQFYRDWKYTYANVNQAYNNGYENFDKTVTVNQIDDSLNNPEQTPSAYATRTYSMEKYGLNVGLIERRFTRWIYDPGVRAARKGNAVSMRAFNHN